MKEYTITRLEQYCDISKDTLGDLTKQKQSIIELLLVIEKTGKVEMLPTLQLELTDDGHLDTIKYCQIDNTLDGFYARFFRDGTLWSIEYYKNGKKHGLVQKWGVSGELTYIANYCEGVPIGIHLDFKSGGLELFDKKTYHDGKLIEHQKFMFDVDKQFCLSRYKDGERHGINEYFDYESQKYISYMYIDGERLEETREMRDCFD